MNCKKCGKDITNNMIEAVTTPTTYHYILDGLSPYDIPYVDWARTKKYFEAEDDHERAEGTPSSIYYCRLCGVKYSKLEISEMFRKGE